jgi:uncharacterized delta-60 repeat protein
MTLDSSGDILLAGSDTNSATGSNADAVVRYTATGIPDPAFGSNGEALLQGTSNGGNFVEAIGLQSTGQIVVSGDFVYDPATGSTTAGVVRLNTDGSVDISFGTNGLFYDTTLFHPQALSVQPDDAILIAGKGPHGGSTFGYLVDRLTAGGQSDPTFGVNGQAQAYFNGMSDAEANAMTLGPDGKIAVTGAVDYDQGGTYYYRLGTARFLNDMTSNTATALATATPLSPAVTPSPVLVSLVPDSPDLWDVLQPLARRRGTD